MIVIQYTERILYGMNNRHKWADIPRGKGQVMYSVKGFKTRQEAEQEKRKNGGVVLWDKLTQTGRVSNIAHEYRIATQATGIDPEKYPYVVERRI